MVAASKFSSPAMGRLAIPCSSLSQKVPVPKPTDDQAMDFIKAQQRLALVETVDMMSAHPHIRMSVRDYAHGLLAAASNEREAIKHDHFDVAPETLGKVDEEFIAEMVVKHTKLAVANVSKCRAFDPKFCSRMWQLMWNALLGLKLPAECIAKPVLRGLVAKRLNDLGNVFKDLKVDGVHVLESGKVNWGKIGIFRATVRAGSKETDDTIITSLKHVYSATAVDVSEEGITEDFDFDFNWSVKQAIFVRNSRKHAIWEFFKTPEQKKAIAPWSGNPKALQDAARAIKDDLARSTTSSVEVTRSDLLKDTTEKRSQAISAAKAKLAQAREENAKKRRISVADGKASA